MASAAAVEILVAALGSSALTGVVSLGVSCLNHRLQSARDRVTDQRGLRDARQQRLRSRYEALLEAALRCDRVVTAMLVSLGPQTREKQDRHLAQQLNESLGGAEKALAALSLETETQDIRQRFNGVWYDFLGYQTAVRDSREAPGALGHEALGRMRIKLKNDVVELEKVMRDHLAELDKAM